MRDFIINFFFSFCAGAGLTVVAYMLILTTCQFIDVIKEYKEKWRKKNDERRDCKAFE